MSRPIRYRRGDGKLLYQPVAGEARQVWCSSYAIDGYEKTWSDSWKADGDTYPVIYKPVVYRSKARAERIGRREEKRRAKAELMRIEEI